jgi:hypothetical protein
LTAPAEAARIVSVGAGLTFSRAVWFGFGAAIAVPLACGGRSTSLDPENAAGEGNGGSAGRGGAGGAMTGSGATGATAMGAMGGTGGTGMGATPGAGGVTAGTGGVLAIPDCPIITPDDRRCLIDSDCELAASRSCCGDLLVQGVSRVSGCAQEPVMCDVACTGTRWITDTGEITTDVSVIQVRCQFLDADAGVCTSDIDLHGLPPPTYCNGDLCTPTEVCVHYAPPGGPPPPCTPLHDGGSCPPDSKEDVCPDTGVRGCIPVQATPLPQCVPAGSGCKNRVDCACLPADICGGLATECAGVMVRDVFCVDQSP